MRCVIIGAMRPVESGKNNSSAEKQQEQADSKCFDQSFGHIYEPIRTVLMVPRPSGIVKNMALAGFCLSKEHFQAILRSFSKGGAMWLERFVLGPPGRRAE